MASALLERLGRRFRVGGPKDLAVLVGSDDAALPPADRMTERRDRFRSGRGVVQDEFRPYHDRIKGYRRYRAIDYAVPEMARSLTVIAINATAGDRNEEPGFRIDYAEGFTRQSRSIVQECAVDRLVLPNRLQKTIREKNRMGDVFYELVLDERGLVWRLKFLLPDHVYVKVDEYDRLVGYVYKGYEGEDQFLEWWRVIHVLHDPEEGSRYGRSLFAGGGWRTAQRLQATRDGLVQETLNRASARHAYALPYPYRMTDDERDDWADDLRDELNREIAVTDDDGDALLYRRALAQLNQSDVLLPYPVDVDAASYKPSITALRSTNTGSIVEVVHHFQDLAAVCTGVPKAFLGIDRVGDSTGTTRLDKEDLQFARQLRGDQYDAAHMVVEILRRQFIFLRRPLRRGDVMIKMPDLREVDRKLRAEITKLLMEAIALAVRSGLPPRWVWYEVIFDGHRDICDQMAADLGIDLDAEFVTAEQKAAEANLALRGKPTDTEMAAAQDHLRERGALVREVHALSRGVEVANQEFTP